MKHIFQKTTLIFACILLFQIIAFAQTNTDAGIKLYQDGKYSEAAQTLKGLSKKDPQAAYYLGLSYEKLGRTEEAINAYKRSVDNVIYQIGQNLIKRYRSGKNIAEISSEDYIRGIMEQKIEPGFASSQRLKEIASKTGDAEERETNYLVLDMYRTKTADSSPVVDLIPLNIISKPQPAYTDEARKQQFSGDIDVIVIFLANGKVGPVYPLNELSYGLTESAVQAAKSIRFTAAKKGGQPVSVIKTIHYGFWLM